MSLFNTIADLTVGFRWKLVGKVSPWRMANIQEEFERNLRRAKGSPVQQPHETKSQAAVRHKKETDLVVRNGQAELQNVLRADNAHPDQLDPLGFVSSSKFRFFSGLGLAAVAAGAGGFFLLQVVRLFRK